MRCDEDTADTGRTDEAARLLTALGREARGRDMSNTAQEVTRTRVADMLGREAAVPVFRLIGFGRLARAAAVMALLAGSGIVAVRLHSTREAPPAASVTAPTLETRIGLAQESLKNQVWIFRERYVARAGGDGVVGTRARRLSTRIAVCAAEIRGELQDAAVPLPGGGEASRVL